MSNRRKCCDCGNAILCAESPTTGFALCVLDGYGGFWPGVLHRCDRFEPGTPVSREGVKGEGPVAVRSMFALPVSDGVPVDKCP